MEVRQQQVKWIVVKMLLALCLVTVTSAITTPAAGPADTCASHPCMNGGRCISYPNAFICGCPDEYSGLRCETHSSQQGVTACSSMPCINGECVSAGPHYTCMCPTQWRGSTCNIDVDECMSNPCLNGAVCHNSAGNYSCGCLLGYAGKNCEEDVSCATNICNNNGTCIEQNGQSVCVCTAGFSGDTCQDKGGCSPNPCQNGHCVLSDEDPNGYVCHCHAGYTARLCDRLLYAACSHDGDTFYDGEMRVDSCNQCHCRGGEWLCTKKFCGSILVMFDFIDDFDTVVQDNEDKFKRLLRTHLATRFSIEESMMDNIVVSAGSIHVEFELVPLVDSHLNIEDVAAEMLAMFDSGTFYFRYEGTSLFIDQSSVQLEKVEPPTTDEPGPPVISNVTLVIVCVLVSLLLVIAVIIGTVVIIIHRRQSEKTSVGQFGGRDKKQEYPRNNASSARHHNDLYSSVPNDNGSAAAAAGGGGELKDINIAMFKVDGNPNDFKSSPVDPV